VIAAGNNSLSLKLPERTAVQKGKPDSVVIRNCNTWGRYARPLERLARVVSLIVT
jgi:hypothetical protein